MAAATGLESRLIRSWVAQGLLPGPSSRGPGARYPAQSLERLLAIMTMRDELGMSLSDIRRELLVATPDQIGSYAAKAANRRTATASPGLMEETLFAPAPTSALEYIRNLRTGATLAAPLRAASETPASIAPTAGLEALEQRLAGSASFEPARKTRAEEWLRVRITPEVELTARGPLDPEQRARLERCADLIRDILLGKH
jgi:DNA-binding transcriptional MerR regulator